MSAHANASKKDMGRRGVYVDNGHEVLAGEWAPASVGLARGQWAWRWVGRAWVPDGCGRPTAK